MSMEASDIKMMLTTAIEGMPEAHQQILSLCYLEELSIAEIAHVLDLTPVQVYRLYLEAVAYLPSLPTFH